MGASAIDRRAMERCPNHGFLATSRSHSSEPMVEKVVHMNRFRLRTRSTRRSRLTPAQRELVRARDQARSRMMACSPEESAPTIARVNALRAVLPRTGAHRQLAEDLGCVPAPSHNSPVIRLNSALKGHRRLYPSILERWNRVLDRYKAAGWPC